MYQVVGVQDTVPVKEILSTERALFLGTLKENEITVVVAPASGVKAPPDELTDPLVILKLGADVPPSPVELKLMDMEVYPEMVMGSLVHVQVYVPLELPPKNWKALFEPLSKIMDMVPLAPEDVSVADHWSPTKVVELEPLSPVKSSEKMVVWAFASGAMLTNPKTQKATRTLRTLSIESTHLQYPFGNEHERRIVPSDLEQVIIGQTSFGCD